MSKFRNYLIAFALVVSLSLPVLGLNSATISGNAEEVKQDALDQLLSNEETKDKWGNVNINDVVISTEGSVAKEVDWNNPIVDGKTEGQLAVESGIGYLVSTIDASAIVYQKANPNINANLSNFANNIVVKVDLKEDNYIEPLKNGYERNYYVLRIHETGDVDQPVEITKLPAELEGRTVIFSSDKFSRFVFGYTDKEINAEQPQQAPATQNNDKPVASYDDGGPFTTDACCNVFDRWGNEIYHAPVCVNESAPVVNNGYQFVNTLDK